MRIVIFPDFGDQIGVGHVKRCLSLAESLSLFESDITFIVSDQISQNLAEEIASKYRLNLSKLNTCDANIFINSFEGEEIDLLVVDHYQIDSTWHKKIKSYFGCTIAALDDLANRSLDVDFLINQSIAIEECVKYKNFVPSNTKILAGIKYALISREYIGYKSAQLARTVESIGIFLGGAAPLYLIKMAIDACRNFAGFNGQIEVVTTSNSQDLSDIHSLAAKDSNIKISVDCVSLARFYAEHDFYIGAGGGSSWERCYMGVASVALQVAENQGVVVSTLSRLGAALTLTPTKILNEENLGGLISIALGNYEMRFACSKASLGLVDGRGSIRIAIALLLHTLKIRSVDESDSEAMFLWRNNPEIRGASLDSRELDWNQHTKWFKEAAASDSKIVLTGAILNRKIGFIRFEKLNSSLEISIYLDPFFIGCGAGGELLKKAEEYVLKINPEINHLVAKVLPDNHRSANMFKKNGYLWTNNSFTKRVIR